MGSNLIKNLDQEPTKDYTTVPVNVIRKTQFAKYKTIPSIYVNDKATMSTVKATNNCIQSKTLRDNEKYIRYFILFTPIVIFPFELLLC